MTEMHAVNDTAEIRVGKFARACRDERIYANGRALEVADLLEVSARLNEAEAFLTGARSVLVGYGVCTPEEARDPVTVIQRLIERVGRCGATSSYVLFEDRPAGPCFLIRDHIHPEHIDENAARWVGEARDE